MQKGGMKKMSNRIDLMGIIEKYHYSHTKTKEKAISEMKKNSYSSKEISIVLAMIDGYFSIITEDETRGQLYRRQVLYQQTHSTY
jgi:hypothetical protein